MRTKLAAVLLIAGAALIAVGAMMGQTVDVLARAVQICMECVGIG